MFLFDAPLTLRELMTGTHPPLADIFRVVHAFLRDRPDAALFGAHAVNAYVDPPRMTADVDVMATDAREFTFELHDRLAREFRGAFRVRVVAQGRGFRIYQLAEPKNRHLVDVRQVDTLPPSRFIDAVQVVLPASLIVLKLSSLVARRRTPKGISDRLDLQRMLLAFPEFRRAASGPVASRLRDVAAPQPIWDAWEELVLDRLDPDDDDAF